MDLKEEQLLGDQARRHWYYLSKSEALLSYLRGVEIARILDVGAGSGFFSRFLLRETNAREAVCVDPNYPADSESAEAGKPVRFRRAAEARDSDLVMMMDVLEHVDDDVALARAYVETAASGTRFLVTVPAFQWMWSGHDVFLEHKRRYTADQLERSLVAAGLRIERCSYFFGLVLPMAIAQRLAERAVAPLRTAAPQSGLQRHSALINGLLLALCRLELPMMRVNRLAGLSVFCLAHKP